MLQQAIASLSLALLMLVPAEAVCSQLVVPDNYAKIQDAIDAAAAGDVILVKNSQGQASNIPVIIDKALTIVGEPYLELEVVECGNYPIPFGAVWLAGPGSGTVTLIGLRTEIPGYDCVWPAPFVAGGGFDALHIYDSDMRPANGGQTGTGYAGHAIDVDVNRVVVVNSTITGGSVRDYDCGGMPGVSAGTAIRLPGGTVVALDSTLVGGSGISTCCTYCSCPPDLTGINGVGGVAVEAALLYSAGTSITGGSGAEYLAYLGGVSGQPPSCGYLADGAAMVVGSSVSLSGDFLGSSGPLVQGLSWTLSWDLSSPMNELFWSPNLGAPTQTPWGLTFLDLSFLVDIGPLPPGPGRVTIQVPNDPFIAGVEVVVQVLGSSSGLSLPVLTAVVP